MLGHRECDGTCQQGEGDCDRDEDCLPGLVCNFDWWFGTDTCQAGKMHTIHINIPYEFMILEGPTTKNYSWGDWSEWGECRGSMCGEGGTRTRTRDCSPPVSTALLIRGRT